MMNNSQAPMTHDEITKTTDLEVIAYYPKELSSEMAVLLRRIAYLKMKSQNTCESQIDALKDVVNFQDFISCLLETRDMDTGELFKQLYPNGSFTYYDELKNA